jgi:hypothetical protein
VWCDSFDADLLKVVPGAAEALGETAGLELTTFSRTTGGKINAPSCWHADAGLASFFWTGPQHKPGPFYYTNQPEAACTFLEAVRDEWVHSAVVVVDGWVVWCPPVRLMERLMYDLRGWTVLDGGEREKIRGDVLASLRSAAMRVARIPAGR